MGSYLSVRSIDIVQLLKGHDDFCAVSKGTSHSTSVLGPASTSGVAVSVVPVFTIIGQSCRRFG